MIRLGRFNDCALLPAIETSAAQAFETVGMAFVAQGDPTPASAYLDSVQERLLWIAVDNEDRPFGFCACAVYGRTLYVNELAVSLQHQQRGAGRALMLAATTGARTLGLERVALRTFRQVAWNRPFYASLHFQIGTPQDIAPLTRTIIDRERQKGLDPESRCTMALRLSNEAL